MLDLPSAATQRRLINARAETIAEKPVFRKSFETHRCLVLADGFFEWQKVPGGKVPYRLTLKDNRPFAFAGIWRQTPDESPPGFAIVTTSPNSLVAAIHDRMPVILEPGSERTWLGATPTAALELLQPYPAELMQAYPVSKLVNSPANDRSEILKPAA